MMLIPKKVFLLSLLVGCLVLLPISVEGRLLVEGGDRRILDGSIFRQIMDFFRRIRNGIANDEDDENENETTDPTTPDEPITGIPCNKVYCLEGEFCCNESCSTCVPEGGQCTEQFCVDDDIPVVCGNTTCIDGEFCCNESCGICAPIDGSCIFMLCLDEGTNSPTDDNGDIEECNVDSDCSPINCITVPCPQPTCINNVCMLDHPTDVVTPCGPIDCYGTQVCCNDFCGVCIEPGTECPMVKCSNPNEGVCGNSICGTGEYCCNESCGICALDGQGCHKMKCSDDNTNSTDDIYDGDVECKVDSDCPPINCITEPCPEAICVDNICMVDDPNDLATPCGPIDCYGTQICCNDICGVCIEPGAECPMVKCIGPPNQVCGDSICTEGEYCCNESCGICAPEGEGCHKMLCINDDEVDSTEPPNAIEGSP